MLKAIKISAPSLRIFVAPAVRYYAEHNINSSIKFVLHYKFSLKAFVKDQKNIVYKAHWETK